MSPLHTTQDEVRVIEIELARVEATVERLQKQRIHLLRRLNHIRSSTGILPPEVLGRIFEHACVPPIYFDSDSEVGPVIVSSLSFWNYVLALRLGHICSYWRQVAWSRPQLWTNLFTCVDGKHGHSVAGKLDLYLHNVRNLPFSLIVHFKDDFHTVGNVTTYSPISKQTMESIEAVFFRDEYSRKFENLCLSGAPTHWLIPISTNFRRLKHISVLGPSYRSQHAPSAGSLFQQSPSTSLTTVSRLHSVALDSYYQSWDLALPYQSITKLVLTSVSIDIIAKLLMQCPNLVNFISRDPKRPTTLITDNIGFPTTTFPRLRNFTWSYHPSPWNLAALRHIRLPVLQRFTWASEMDSNDPLDSVGIEPAVRTLFASIPHTTLRTVRLFLGKGFASLPWTPSLFKHIFSRLTSARELTLEDCDYRSICTVLQVLCPGGDGDETIYLPSLEYLTILNDFGSVFGYGFSSRILELYKRRSAARCSVLTVRVDQEELLDETVESEMSEVIRAGFLQTI